MLTALPLPPTAFEWPWSHSTYHLPLCKGLLSMPRLLLYTNPSKQPAQCFIERSSRNIAQVNRRYHDDWINETIVTRGNPLKASEKLISSLLSVAMCLSHLSLHHFSVPLLRISTKPTLSGSEALAGSPWILWTMWELLKTRKWWIRYAKASLFLPVTWPPYLLCGARNPVVGRLLSIISISLQVKYKKAAIDNYPNFTSVEDTPEIVLAKFNSVNQSDVSLLCIMRYIDWGASCLSLNNWLNSR